jgi:hypothetical protein
LSPAPAQTPEHIVEGARRRGQVCVWVWVGGWGGGGGAAAAVSPSCPLSIVAVLVYEFLCMRKAYEGGRASRGASKPTGEGRRGSGGCGAARPGCEAAARLPACFCRSSAGGGGHSR